MSNHPSTIVSANARRCNNTISHDRIRMKRPLGDKFGSSRHKMTIIQIKPQQTIAFNCNRPPHHLWTFLHFFNAFYWFIRYWVSNILQAINKHSMHLPGHRRRHRRITSALFLISQFLLRCVLFKPNLVWCDIQPFFSTGNLFTWEEANAHRIYHFSRNHNQFLSLALWWRMRIMGTWTICCLCINSFWPHFYTRRSTIHLVFSHPHFLIFCVIARCTAIELL